MGMAPPYHNLFSPELEYPATRQLAYKLTEMATLNLLTCRRCRRRDMKLVAITPLPRPSLEINAMNIIPCPYMARYGLL